MGNNVASAKGALAFANAKSQADSFLSGDGDKKKKVIENPETRREMNQRHKDRDME